MKKTLVIGVGSILKGDDGIGPRIIDELENEPLPDNVTLERGDLSGMDLIKFFPEFERVIIVDAADMKEPFGSIKVFTLSQIKKATFADTFSTHGMALLEALTLAKKLDIKSEIIIIGIQPKDVSYNLELTDLIESKIPSIISRIGELL